MALDTPADTDSTRFARAGASAAQKTAPRSSKGVPFAEIGRMVGQRKLSVTADTYTHVLSDRREASFQELLG